MVVEIDTSSPTPTIRLAPASDSGVAGDGITNVTDPTFTGVAKADSTIKVQIDGKVAGTTLANAAGVWRFTPAIPLAKGDHIITTIAVDVAGNISIAAHLSVQIETTSPTPTIRLAPTSDSGVAGDGITKVADPTFTGVAKAGSTIKVQIDGRTAGTALANAAGVWRFAPATPLANGDHAITATAVDVAGNVSTAAHLSVQIETTSPTPTIGLATGSDSGVVGDDITNVADPTFTGVAKAGSTIKVQIDGKVAGTALANAAGVWRFAPAIPLAKGDHTITATAVDVAGNISTAAHLSVQIETTSPTPTIGLATGSDSGVAGDGTTNVADPTFTGVAKAGSTIKVQIDGKVAGTALANAAGVWRFAPATPLANGDHAITATAVDVADNISTAAHLSVQIETTSPTTDHRPGDRQRQRCRR